MSAFKAPTLRNIALTAPYMHDGSIATLEEVLEHYEKGGRAHHAGRTDALLVPFKITAQEKADVIAFLEKPDGYGPDHGSCAVRSVGRRRGALTRPRRAPDESYGGAIRVVASSTKPRASTASYTNDPREG